MPCGLGACEFPWKLSGIIGGVFGGIGGRAGRKAVDAIREAQLRQIKNNITQIIDPTAVGAARAHHLSALVWIRITNALIPDPDKILAEYMVKDLIYRFLDLFSEEKLELREELCPE